MAAAYCNTYCWGDGGSASPLVRKRSEDDDDDGRAPPAKRMAKAGDYFGPVVLPDIWGDSTCPIPPQFYAFHQELAEALIARWQAKLGLSTHHRHVDIFASAPVLPTKAVVVKNVENDNITNAAITILKSAANTQDPFTLKAASLVVRHLLEGNVGDGSGQDVDTVQAPTTAAADAAAATVIESVEDDNDDEEKLLIDVQAD